MNIIYFLGGLLLGGLAVWFYYRSRYKFPTFSSLSDANAISQQNKEEAKTKILSILSEQGEISNDMVEKIINVSDSTATRYLEELEQADKIVQIGREGQSVRYRLK